MMIRRVTATGLGGQRDAVELVVVAQAEVLAGHLEGDQPMDLDDSQRHPLATLPHLRLQHR